MSAARARIGAIKAVNDDTAATDTSDITENTAITAITVTYDSQH